MSVYYNENDPYAAQWLRNQIAAGHLPAGVVDDRSIKDVQPEDLEGFTQCHFFAGIGGWPLALRMAGWPDERPVWTGSCPCQPFSGAGKQQGEKDARHLWPDFLRLIVEWAVPTIFGEQVASALGREWLVGVSADLEELDYVVGAADLCAAGVGAPHIRQRLFWVADAAIAGRGAQQERSGIANGWAPSESGRLCGTGGLADDNDEGRRQFTQRNGGTPAGSEIQHGADVDGRRDVRRVEHAQQPRLERHTGDGARQFRHVGQVPQQDRSVGPTGDALDRWSTYNIVHCTDGKTRRFEPSIFPLAHAGEWGSGSRVGLLRGAGNAIVPALAVEFIKAYEEARSTAY